MPVLAIGVFDLFHKGHVELLRQARELGSRLVVVINGDEFTARYKRRPSINEEDRLHVVRSCRHVDDAVIAHGANARPYIERYGIRIVVHGDDWEHSSYMKQICLDEDYLRSQRVELRYIPYYRGESTSAIINRIKRSD
ncbi:MAG: adenylyltransferase/cytidyltransferase family protein [Pseudomonadota bacterium]